MPKDSQETKGVYWLVFAGLLICVLFFYAKPLPYGNEFPYLLRLAKEFQPEFLLNDWTFSAPGNEHWFFNRIFGYLAGFVRIELIGWVGRIASWFLLIWGLLKLGKLWKITYPVIAISILAWLVIGQSLVGDEWIIGGFEAKSVSYIFLLTALYHFANRKIIFPAAMLGTAFAFHPAIGLWSAIAVGIALLFERVSLKKLLTVTVIVSLIALIGVLPLLFDQFQNLQENAEIWRFMVTVVFPFHFDPFDFSRSYTVLLLAMLGVNCFVFYKNDNFGLRFLLKFQIALGIFFLFAYILRWFEMYAWLRFLPVRLFPVFTPLFFAFTVGWVLKNLKSQKVKFAVILFTAFCVFWLNPFSTAYTKVGQTIALWQAEPGDFQKTSRWIAENTPNGTVVIQPPHRREVWYFSQRACIASYAYPTFGRLTKWKERVSDLTGNEEIKYEEDIFEKIEKAYNLLPEEEIENLRVKYKSDYLVSRAVYSYPIVFQTATYRVYFLKKQ